MSAQNSELERPALCVIPLNKSTKSFDALPCLWTTDLFADQLLKGECHVGIFALITAGMHIASHRA